MSVRLEIDATLGVGAVAAFENAVSDSQIDRRDDRETIPPGTIAMQPIAYLNSMFGGRIQTEWIGRPDIIGLLKRMQAAWQPI